MTTCLGIDGGGTKTTCVVGDESKVLSTGLGGGCNVVRRGAEQARASIHAAILQAISEADVSPQNIARTCIGAAGISAPGVSMMLRKFITEVVSGEVDVVGDHEIAFEAGFGPGPGTIVISGTGSIAWGRNKERQYARAGGYGFAVSDEGSGHWIGRTAVSQTLRAIDHGVSTKLHGLILDAWKIDANALVRTANAIPLPDFAGLCPLVVEAAEDGDQVAKAVLCRAGTELADLAGAVLDRLWPPDEPVRVAMVSGVFKSSAMVRDHFRLALQNRHKSALSSE